jgi:ribosomal protein S18 acetylase RimI-like enzyme
MQIRRAQVDDAALFAELAARTFRDTFAHLNTAQDMATHLASSYSEAIQRAQLESPSIRVLLLERDGEPVGYAQLRSGHAPDCVPSTPTIELWRFYIDRSGIGLGLAQTLMQAVYAHARDAAAQSLWLGVWEHNARAIAFYRKCGFREVGAHPFHLGEDLQTDLIVLRDLDEPTP